MGLLLKLFFAGIVLLASFFAVSLLLFSAQDLVILEGFAPGSGGDFESSLELLLALTVTASVGTFFTIPLLLAMFGHGGAWLKHVAAKVGKWLALAMLLGFGFYIGGGVVSEVTVGLAGSVPTWILPPAAIDFYIPLIVVSLFVVLLLGHRVIMKGLEDLAFSISGRFPSLSDLAPRANRTMGTVELQQFPTRQIRDKLKPERAKAESLRFQRFAQTLTTLVGRTEFRLSFRQGRGRTLLSASGRESRIELERRLLSIVRTHMFEYQAAPLQQTIGVARGQSHTILVMGSPEVVENPLEPLAHYFLENNYVGDYRVVMVRAGFSPLRRLLAVRKQRGLSKRAGEQRTERTSLGMSEKSKTMSNHLAEIEHEESVKAVERHASRTAVKAWVFVTGYGETKDEARRIAEGGVAVVRGTLSSNKAISALKVRAVGKVKGQLGSRGRPTILLPAEVAPFIWIPQMAMGAEISPSAEFELSPDLKGEIDLGNVVVQSGMTEHHARLPLDVLVKHSFITGMTGTGKTTSCFNLLIQLYQLGIPFLVIEPVKSEYRSLLTSIPSLQVFTIGDEETAPFRLNIFDPPNGVKVQTHLENLEAAWNGSFVMYAPLPYVVKEVLVETYKACGWDVNNNKRGKPITLDDFRLQSEKVSRRLGYEPNVTMNIEAALRTRIMNLSLGGKGPLFNTISSLPLDDILRRPTVIELKSVPSNEEKAFIAALLLMNMVEHVETKGRSKELRHLTLVEEAHRLLPNISTQKGDPEGADPRKRMVEQFANMLAEMRAYGEGLAIVEQIPTKIIPDALKNTATKIAHRVPAADDREVLAGAMNLTKAQMAVFTALQPGEAIISLEKHPLPIKIQVPNTIEKASLPLGDVKDEEVKRHMADFYLRNPLPRPPQSMLQDAMLPMVDSDWFKKKFTDAYREWFQNGATDPLADLLIQGAKKWAKDEEEALEIASKLLSLAVAFYLPFDEVDREKFPRVFMQQVKRSIRDGRRK